MGGQERFPEKVTSEWEAWEVPGGGVSWQEGVTMTNAQEQELTLLLGIR